MSYPFYTWFSIVGVLIQFAKTVIKIFFIERPFSITHWILFFSRFFIVLVGFLVLPAGLMVIPLDTILQYNATLGTVWNVAIFMVLYVMGVLGARYLYRWEKQNMERHG